MKPIGLTNKRNGELMIVHQCLNCGKTSCNRIAGDDNTCATISLLEINASAIKHHGIELLTNNDKDYVLTVLYGYNYLDRI